MGAQLQSQVLNWLSDKHYALNSACRTNGLCSLLQEGYIHYNFLGLCRTYGLCSLLQEGSNTHVVDAKLSRIDRFHADKVFWDLGGSLGIVSGTNFSVSCGFSHTL